MRVPGAERTSKFNLRAGSFLAGRDSGARGRIGSTVAALPIGVLLALVSGACSAATESPVIAGSASPSEAVTPRAAPSRGAFGTVPAATRGFPSVVILEPDVLGTAAPAGGAGDSTLLPAQVMDQIGGDFVPGVLLVQPGQPIEFRNSEDVLHNVHIADLETHTTVANVATLLGAPYTMALDRTGTYLVVCDVHPAMEAYIIVTSSLHAVVANDDGSFRLPEVPPGRYAMEVWNVEQAKRNRRSVAIAQTPADVTMRDDVPIGVQTAETEGAGTASSGERDGPGTADGSGTLEGFVRFSGDVLPQPTRVQNSTDPVICGPLQNLEDLLVSAPDHGIKNVIVALEGVTPETMPSYLPSRLALENRDCRFVPHVSVLTVGSTIVATNSDSVLHTEHYYGALSANVALPLEGVTVTTTAGSAGMIIVKCDVHTWMQAFIRVDAHPFHAVSGVNGYFRIEDVPAGTYRLEIWHERLGTQEQTIRIAAGETQTIQVTYSHDNR